MPPVDGCRQASHGLFDMKDEVIPRSDKHVTSIVTFRFTLAKRYTNLLFTKQMVTQREMDRKQSDHIHRAFSVPAPFAFS